MTLDTYYKRPNSVTTELNPRRLKQFRSNKGANILGNLTGVPQNSPAFTCKKPKAFDRMVQKFFSLDEHIKSLTNRDGTKSWELSDDSWSEIASEASFQMNEYTRTMLNLILLKSTYKANWHEIFEYIKNMPNYMDVTYNYLMKFITSTEDHALTIKNIIAKHQPALVNLKTRIRDKLTF